MIQSVAATQYRYGLALMNALVRQKQTVDKMRSRIFILRGTMHNAKTILAESNSKNRKANAEKVIADLEKELAKLEEWF